MDEPISNLPKNNKVNCLTFIWIMMLNNRAFFLKGFIHICLFFV